jgi:hypothetical protein
MPRYYFHFRHGPSIFKDEVGEMFADASLALKQAEKIALELARGGEPTDAMIIVAEAISIFSKFHNRNIATKAVASAVHAAALAFVNNRFVTSKLAIEKSNTAN